MENEAGTGDAGDAVATIFKPCSCETASQPQPQPQLFSTEAGLPENVPEYKYPELESKFQLHDTIGNGGFSKVKLATELRTGNKVAIKIIDKEQIGEEFHRIELEVKVLEDLNHPHICKLHDVIKTDKHIFMILDYCPKDLFDYIDAEQTIPIDEARKIFIQLLSAVAYLHSQGIAHRDLKPENVLLDHNLDVKLTDFGLCASPGKMGINRAILRTLCGSPAYCAPELLKSPPYIGSKVDVWSLGVLLYVMLVGQLPFYSKVLKDLYNKIQEGRYTIPRRIPSPASDLIRMMLEVNVNLRPSLYRLWSHPWVQQGPLAPYEEQIGESKRILDSTEPLNPCGCFTFKSSKFGLGDSDIAIRSMVAVPYVVMHSNRKNTNTSLECLRGDSDSVSDVASNNTVSSRNGYNDEMSDGDSGSVIKKNLNPSGFKRIRGKVGAFFTKWRSQLSPCGKGKENTEDDFPTSVELSSLMLHKKTHKNAGLMLVNEEFAECALDKLQCILQSLGIQSQRDGWTVKHGATSPCRFKFEILYLETWNTFCLRRKYLTSRNPHLSCEIMQKILLIE